MDYYSKAASGDENIRSNFAAMTKKITWWQAAIIGIMTGRCDAGKERYEEFGSDGLFDRRLGKPGPKRVPVKTVEQVLGLYRESYFDLKVRHFHEKLYAERGIEPSCTWVKPALQGAGLIARGAQTRETAAAAGPPSKISHISIPFGR